MARAKETTRKLSDHRRSARLTAPPPPAVKSGSKKNVKPGPKTKKVVRHHKLLRADKEVSKKNSNIHDANTDKSPLLAPPAELRNKIWRFIFGDRTVHVYKQSYERIYHSICVNPIHDHDTAIGLQKHLSKHTATYRERHKDCELGRALPTDDHLDLSILQVCREIHREAALIAYANIDKAQAKAITSLVIYDFNSIWSGDGHYVRQLKLPAGLRELTCFIESPCTADVPWYDLHSKKDALFHFARTPVQEVRVLLKGPAGGGRLVVGFNTPPIHVGEWARDMEGMVRSTWEGAKQLRLEGTDEYEREQADAEKRKERRSGGGRLRARKDA